MATITCPSEEDLRCYAFGRLGDEALEAVAAHLESCPDCAAALATFDDAEDTLIAQIRRGTAATPYLQEPECQLASDRARAVCDPSFSEGAQSSPSIVGTVLGEYQLIEELGRGGMGRVYKALHTKLDRVVAVKVLPRGRLGDEKAVARFEREMKAVGRLAHPNIVQAHDAREINGNPLLIMEFVDGLDLAEISRRLGRVPAPDACELVRRTALALQCAHEHGLVHRDIKPSNIMLGRTGEVKLLDLGLARFYAESTGEETTGTGIAMGTADYMAPEQAADSRAVDIRADLYALGCTLYKLLSGRAPFSGADYRTTLEKLNAHVHQPAPFIRGLVPDVPERLAAILDRLLAKDPNDRFVAPAEVAEAITPLCEGTNLQALIERAMATPIEHTLHDSSLSGAQARSAQPEPQPAPLLLTSWGWKWFIGQLLLLLMVGGLGFALGVMITIRREGKETKIEVPEGSHTRVTPEGQVDVTLPLNARTPAASMVSDLSTLYSRWKVLRVEKGRNADTAWADIVTYGSPLDPRKMDYFDFVRNGGRDEDDEDYLSIQYSADPHLADVHFRFRINPTAMPKAIDMLRSISHRDAPATMGIVAVGIYKLDGDQLLLHLTRYRPSLEADSQRPKTFSIDPTSDDVLFVLQKPKESALQFGPVIERVINAVDAGENTNAVRQGKGNEAIDLAGGRLLDVPKEFGTWSAEQQGKWGAENNVDLVVDSVSATGSFGAGGMGGALKADVTPEDLKFGAIANETWDSVTHEELLSAITSPTPGSIKGPIGIETPVAGVSERAGITRYELWGVPVTFAFQTRKGILGILQVIRFTEDPRGIRIRYKLVQPAPPARPSAFVAPAPPGAEPGPNSAPLALDGFCPVTLAEKHQWARGNRRFGVIHRGRTYLFAGPDEQRRFMADPDRYAMPQPAAISAPIAPRTSDRSPDGYPYAAKMAAAGVSDWAKRLFRTTSHDFGTVARGASAEYRFMIANGFAEDIHIKSVSSDFPRCFSASLIEGITDALLKARTATNELLVRMNTTEFVGRRSGSITIDIDAPVPAKVVLEVTGYIGEETAAASPPPAPVAPQASVKTPDALPLLHGVETARRPNVPLRVSLAIDGRQYLIDCEGEKRRFESELPGARGKKIVIKDGDKFYDYPGQDLPGPDAYVAVYDMHYATGREGTRCFDPRILGLCDLMSADTTVAVCLQPTDVPANRFSVVGKEQVDGVAAWRVEATRDDVSQTKFNWWIEPGTHRVYRKTTSWALPNQLATSIDVSSQYQPNDSTAVLPMRVHIKRIAPNPQSSFENLITVSKVEWPSAIPAERFTLASMDLPKATRIVDRRNGQTISVWKIGVMQPVVREVTPQLEFSGLLQQAAGPGRTWVYFDVDERAVVRIRKSIQEGNLKAEDLKVLCSVNDENDFRYRGTVKSVDVSIDPAKGVAKWSALLENADSVLLPGMNAHVRLIVGKPRRRSCFRQRCPW